VQIRLDGFGNKYVSGLKKDFKGLELRKPYCITTTQPPALLSFLSNFS
jgi:hypothetical protein